MRLASELLHKRLSNLPPGPGVGAPDFRIFCPQSAAVRATTPTYQSGPSGTEAPQSCKYGPKN
eukprot:7867808-Lingulodinium_polyedra.AAC.1